MRALRARARAGDDGGRATNVSILAIDRVRTVGKRLLFVKDDRRGRQRATEGGSTLASPATSTTLPSVAISLPIACVSVDQRDVIALHARCAPSSSSPTS